MATKNIQNPIVRKAAEYGLITFSIWIMVVGIYFFKFPNNFAFGGVTGFSTVVARLQGILRFLSIRLCWPWGLCF